MLKLPKTTLNSLGGLCVKILTNHRNANSSTLVNAPAVATIWKANKTFH